MSVPQVYHESRVREAVANAAAPELVDHLCSLFKALGDATRLRLVLALRDGEMCVRDLAAFLGVSESAVSHQLRRLRELALVARRRDGHVLYYRLDDEHVSELLEVTLTHAQE